MFYKLIRKIRKPISVVEQSGDNDMLDAIVRWKEKALQVTSIRITDERM
jgi:hypothetical protein